MHLHWYHSCLVPASQQHDGLQHGCKHTAEAVPAAASLAPSRHPSQRASSSPTQTYAGDAQTVLLLSLRVQVKYIFGYSQYVVPATKTVKAHTVTFPRHDPIQEQLRDLLGHQWTPYFHWREFVMGGTFLVILIAMKHIGRRYPK